MAEYYVNNEFSRIYIQSTNSNTIVWIILVRKYTELFGVNDVNDVKKVTY